MMWEYYAGAGILLFGALQLGMALLNWKCYPLVKRWKNSLLNSHSIPAKLALTIFF